MLEKESNPSTHARCVRLYHTEQGRSDQKVKLLCTNENYTCKCWIELPPNKLSWTFFQTFLSSYLSFDLFTALAVSYQNESPPADTACNQYPNKPCWYEVCYNYDLCNSAPGASQINIIILGLLATLTLLLSFWNWTIAFYFSIILVEQFILSLCVFLVLYSFS